MKLVTLAEWNQFIQSMYDSWMNRDRTRYKNIDFFVSMNRFVILVNHRTGKTVMAKCHRKDEFDTKTGTAIAWARYLGKEIPKVGTRIYTGELQKLPFGTKLYVREKTDSGKFWDHEMTFAGFTGSSICLYDPDSNYTTPISKSMFEIGKKDPAITAFLPM